MEIKNQVNGKKRKEKKEKTTKMIFTVKNN